MLLLAAAVATTGVHAADGCFEPDAVGFRIPPVIVPGYGMCPRGFYCPNSDVANASTYPVFCKPSTECLQRRIHFEYCEPQGLFEPTVCPEGYYCPTGREKRKCPSGYRCPYGTVTPRKCGGLSLCPEGSNTELFLGVLLVLALVDGLIVAGYLALRRYFAQPSKLDPLVAHMDPAEASDYAATLVRKALGTAEPVSVVFDDLRVTLPADHKTAPNKQLLQGVSGTLKAGEVTAIMGPSGAGKTVLFTTILGKQPAEWCVDGDLRVCGAHKFTDFPECVGFVPQDDVLRAELTMHENVKYTTDIRLPASWTSEDRLAMRTAVLRALGVDHVRDVPIGDEEQRGVSGGQRKRCSVACELAAAPAAIFLDEPTTGLDAHTSLELVRTLKVIARKARIPVAMVVHQPRVEIWEELDAVLLLAPGGRTVYSGTREGAESYLQAYAPEADFSVGNPCDTAMDVITARGAPLADAWTQASQEAALTAGSAAARPDANQEHGTVDPPRREIAGRLRQFALAHWRQLVIQYRTAHVFLLDVLLCMIGGVLLTSAAIDSPFVGQLQGLYIAVSPRTNIQNVSMLCMLWGIAFAAGLGPAGVRVLTKGRPSYWREAAAGHSRLAFYLGATSAELYRVTVTVLHFSAVVYLMWQPNMSFGLVFGFLLLYGFCHDSQAVMLGSFVDPFIAPLLATVIGVFTSLLNGFPQIPAVSPFSYSWAVTELFYKAEIHDVGHVFRTDTLEDNFGHDFERPGYDYGIAFGEAMLFRLLAFVFVIALNRDKQR